LDEETIKGLNKKDLQNLILKKFIKKRQKKKNPKIRRYQSRSSNDSSAVDKYEKEKIKKRRKKNGDQTESRRTGTGNRGEANNNSNKGVKKDGNPDLRDNTQLYKCPACPFKGNYAQAKEHDKAMDGAHFGISEECKWKNDPYSPCKRRFVWQASMFTVFNYIYFK